MEYVEGQELKSIVEASSPGGTPLLMDDIINYASQIAAGFKMAHDKKIIHRDIKSSNIMLTNDGKIKIMDFGLAKVSGGVDLTKEHSTFGTVAYMSPEQVQS